MVELVVFKSSMLREKVHTSSLNLERKVDFFEMSDGPTSEWKLSVYIFLPSITSHCLQNSSLVFHHTPKWIWCLLLGILFASVTVVLYPLFVRIWLSHQNLWTFTFLSCKSAIFCDGVECRCQRSLFLRIFSFTCFDKYFITSTLLNVCWVDCTRHVLPSILSIKI